jgi:hypothetical protein
MNSHYVIVTPGTTTTSLDEVRPAVLNGSVHAVAERSRYDTDGRCREHPGDAAIFVEPHVPNDAIRNGRLDPALSTVDLNVEGIGALNGIHLTNPPDLEGRHSSRIAVRVGGCDRGADCTMEINSMSALFPASFALGDHMASGLALRFAGTPTGLPAFGKVNRTPELPSDNWELLPDRWLPLELTGHVDTNRLAASADWTNAGPLAERPHGAFSVRRGSDKFIDVEGTIRQLVDHGDGMTNVSLVARLHYVFYGGAPVPDMAVATSPLSSEHVVLDGTPTWDDLGGTPYLGNALAYQWLTEDDYGQLGIIGFGPRAQLPRAEYRALLSESKRICLRVYDIDGHYDTVCRLPVPLPPVDPGIPSPGSGDVALTPATTQTYNRIVGTAGVFSNLNKAPKVTMLVPRDGSFKNMTPERLKTLTTNKQAAAEFVARHVIFDSVDIKDLAKRFPDFRGTLVGLKPQPGANGIVYPVLGLVGE